MIARTGSERGAALTILGLTPSDLTSAALTALGAEVSLDAALAMTGACRVTTFGSVMDGVLVPGVPAIGGVILSGVAITGGAAFVGAVTTGVPFGVWIAGAFDRGLT